MWSMLRYHYVEVRDDSVDWSQLIVESVSQMIAAVLSLLSVGLRRWYLIPGTVQEPRGGECLPLGATT